MRIPDDTIERIKQAADIVEVVGDFVSLKKRGSNYIACCPFHNEKTPSFNVNPARQIYKCFGCGKAGDPVRFVMDIENIGYGEALRFLAKKYGIEIEEQAPTPEDLLKQNERESLFIVLNFAKTYFAELLTNHDEGQSIGLSYFRERGFTTPTIQAFELGYSLNSWDGLLQEAERRGYSRDLLEKAGLILNKTDDGGSKRDRVFDRFRGRVMFPIHNVSGRVIAFGARILVNDKNQPKYLNSPETEVYHKSAVLYGIYQAKQTIRQEDVCYLTEGYTDVISLHQAGIKNVVASSGTSLTIEQIRLIGRFTQNVTILYDGDAAGIKAALRGLDMVLEEGLNVSIVTFPDGEDPDSYVRRVGAEAFKAYIKSHTSDFIRFKTDVLLRDAGDNPFKRAEVIGEVVSSIIRIPDALQRQVFFRTTAAQLRVDEQTLISEGNRLMRKQQEQQSRDQQRQRDRDQNRPQNGPVNRGSAPDASLADINALLSEAGIDGPPDDFFLDDIPAGIAPPAPTPEARTAPKPERSGLSFQEEECIRLLVNYGTRELEPGITLCQYVLSELDGIDFQTSPYNLMLTLFREAYLHGDILTADDFLRKPEQIETHREAINLTTPRHEISDGWLKHEIIVPSEEDVSILADAAYGNILRIKKMLAEQKMLEIRRGIVETTDPDESDRLMAEYMHYKRVDVEIAKLLGTVISG
ncbi:DNA primase [Rudanella paleaurantiibacter]|uniref:DNA primase n=1 Tax=Rudanella paleaurantiibacter TaxID=2614655 RepID=A0A7J5TWI5_9BACT|nr:DNA primase [Rudanella paleaurantiibacter]KAB7728759.1 DNA primase [Rudanella paleaurantiibacter]